jgi:hypothetical protein
MSDCDRQTPTGFVVISGRDCEFVSWGGGAFDIAIAVAVAVPVAVPVAVGMPVPVAAAVAVAVAFALGVAAVGVVLALPIALIVVVGGFAVGVGVDVDVDDAPAIKGCDRMDRRAAIGWEGSGFAWPCRRYSVQTMRVSQGQRHRIANRFSGKLI